MKPWRHVRPVSFPAIATNGQLSSPCNVCVCVCARARACVWLRARARPGGGLGERVSNSKHWFTTSGGRCRNAMLGVCALVCSTRAWCFRVSDYRRLPRVTAGIWSKRTAPIEHQFSHRQHTHSVEHQCSYTHSDRTSLFTQPQCGTSVFTQPQCEHQCSHSQRGTSDFSHGHSVWTSVFTQPQCGTSVFTQPQCGTSVFTQP